MLFFVISFEIWCEEYALLEPVKIQENSYEKNAFEIKTNFPGAEIFINGVYQGKSDLIVKNYIPGTYFLEIHKKGYGVQKYSIEVLQGYFQSFYVELYQLSGKLELSDSYDFENLQIFIDGAEVCTENGSIELPLGEHSLKIRKFGYEDFEKVFEIKENETCSIDLSFTESDFFVKDFFPSKEVLNPDYKSKLGEVIFYFEVTSGQEMSFLILDENQKLIFKKDLDEAFDWKQKVVWTGISNSGDVVPAGVYTAIVCANNQEFFCEQKVRVTEEKIYPLFSITKAGSGVGTLPFLAREFMENSKGDFMISPFVDLKPILQVWKANETDDYGKESQKLSGAAAEEANCGVFVALKSMVGFEINFLKHYEVSLSFDVYPGFESSVFSAGGAVKLGWGIDLPKSGFFYYGGFVHYGYSNDQLYGESGLDTGNGLGTGLLLGVDFPIINFGISSQFIFAANNGILNQSEKDNVWKSGMTFCVKPGYQIMFNTWVALNNLTALEMGGGLVVLPAAGVLIDFSCDVKWIFEKTVYLSSGIMLSYSL